jgi:DNA repair exonuclease SbcCD nuclease subunit
MIIVADLHLGDTHDSILVEVPPQFEYLGKRASSRTVETFLRLEEAAARAYETNQSVIIAGDVFDSSRPDPRVMAQFVSFVSKWDDHGSGPCLPAVSLYVIPGNHDADAQTFSTYPLEAMFGNRVFKHSICQEKVDGVDVCFVPHLNEAALAGYELFGGWEVAAKSVMTESCKLIVTHGGILGCQSSDEELARANIIDPSHFSKDVTIIMGHYHEPRDWNIEGVHVVIPGSVSYTSFAYVDEALGFVEYTPMFDRVTHVDYQTVVVPYCQFNITAARLKTLKEDVAADACRGTIIKLVVEAESRRDVDELAVRKLFGAAAKIAKFEVRTPKDEQRQEKAALNLDHKPVSLLSKYLKDQKKAGVSEKVTEVALREGKKIIEKVSHA